MKFNIPSFDNKTNEEVKDAEITSEVPVEVITEPEELPEDKMTKSQILRKYNLIESDIPLNSPYWKL